ncbi:unnamed protein product, partial [Rotaria sp. Silwood1]
MLFAISDVAIEHRNEQGQMLG